MSLGPISGHLDGTEAEVRVYIVALNRVADDPRKVRRIRKVDVGVVVLLAALVPDIHDGEHCPGSERVLDADAVLVRHRQLVLVDGQTGDAGDRNRSDGRLTVLQERTGVIQRYITEVNGGTERNVRAGVIHIVALDTLVHHAETAAQNRLTGARQIVGKSEPRTKRCPLGIDQPLGNASCGARNADTVQVELVAGKDRIRAGAQTRTHASATGISSAAANVAVRVQEGGIRWVEKAGIEVAHSILGFVGVRHAVPAQAEVQGQSLVHPPVVLYVKRCRNVVPEASILHSELVVAARLAEEEIGEVQPGKATAEAERALRIAKQVLGLLIDRPTATHLELVRTLGPGHVVAELVIVRLVVPRPTVVSELRQRRSPQADVRDAGVVVRASEEAVEGEVRRGGNQTGR